MNAPFLIFSLFSSLAFTLATRNILLYAPGYGGSHIVFHSRMADAIAKAGYNVISFEPEMHVNPADFKGAKLAERYIVSGLVNMSALTEKEGDYRDELGHIFDSDSIYSTYLMAQTWKSQCSLVCEQIILRQDVLDHLRSYKFDAIIYEPFFLCGTGIAHLLGIQRHIFITSLPLFEYAAGLMGLPFPASHLPSIFMPADYSDQEMGYFERLYNIFAVEAGRYSLEETVKQTQTMFEKHYGPNMPNLEMLAREASLCFVEADEFLDYPRPFQANVVPLGPLGLEENADDGNGTTSPLESPFDLEMRRGENGVVLVSLGTHASTRRMPTEFLANLLKAMGEFPKMHFVMKTDKEDKNITKIANSLGIKNIFFAKWLPQAKLLAHPNLRLFISHSGFNSLMESAYFGVPIVAIPFFVDQLRNANFAVRNGWGIKVARQRLLKGHSQLAAAINEILSNPLYKQKAARTKRLIGNKPQSGQQRLKAHLDLLFLHADGDLPEWKSAARHMGPIAYYNLDIFIPAFLIAQIALFLFTKMLIFVFQKIISKK